MSGLSASGLKTQIRSYTEVDDTVLTDAVLENIILQIQEVQAANLINLVDKELPRQPLILTYFLVDK